MMVAYVKRKIFLVENNTDVTHASCHRSYQKKTLFRGTVTLCIPTTTPATMTFLWSILVGVLSSDFRDVIVLIKRKGLLFNL